MDQKSPKTFFDDDDFSFAPLTEVQKGQPENFSTKDKTIELVVPAAENGLRLDIFLSRHLEYSRAQLARQAKGGFIQGIDRQGQKHSLKSAAQVFTGQRIVLMPPPVPITTLLPCPEVKLEIIFEDDDILVINKPCGLLVHPGAGKPEATLAGALLAYNPQLNEVGEALRPGLVHRLDKETSGVIVTAKNEKSLQRLSAAFQDRSLEKIYLALVKGKMAKSALIDKPIGRHPSLRYKMAAGVKGGRPAQTIYHSLKYFSKSDVSLVLLKLLTGRTHQIRVHLSDLGHSILGDQVYGRPAEILKKSPFNTLVKRQLLHARRLSLFHPTSGQNMNFQAPWPPDFLAVFQALLKYERN